MKKILVDGCCQHQDPHEQRHVNSTVDSGTCWVSPAKGGDLRMEDSLFTMGYVQLLRAGCGLIGPKKGL